jgi:hypothetical protein
VRTEPLFWRENGEVVDERDHAARVYESVGFSPSERSGALGLRPGR